MLTLSIPARRDPIARGVLLVLIAGVAWLAIARPGVEPVQAQSEPEPIILIATPTLFVPMPTEQPAVAQAAPTPVPGWPSPVPVPAVEPAPVILQQQPEVIYQQPDPIIIEQPAEQIVVTVPPVITYQTAVPETRQQLPSGAEVIVIATPGPGDPGFADSFGASDPKAKCQFVGCL